MNLPGLNLDPNFMLLSLIPGGVGLVLFVYGKKQQRIPQMVAGVLLMVYPYALETSLALVGVGLLIGLGLWVALQLGW